jgi:hypothetical protein
MPEPGTRWNWLCRAARVAPSRGVARSAAGVLLYLLTAFGKYIAVRLRLCTGEKFSPTVAAPLP